MKLKFNADMPCGVFLDGKQFTTPFDLETKPFFLGQMTVLPTNPEKYAGYSLCFTIEEDRLKSLSGGASGVSWGAGLGEIKLIPPITQKTTMPEVIRQKKVEQTQITVYSDGAPKVMCEGSSFFAKDLPYNLTDITLSLSSDGNLCAIRGKQESKSYLLALSLFDSEWKIMHEITADIIETTTSGVITKDILPTMLRHEKKCVYKPFNLSPTDTDFIPTINHEYVDELIPYLFLEEVSIGASDATNLLDNELSIDFDGVREFLGEFDYISTPPFSKYGLDVVAIYNSKERLSHPNLYKIESKNGKITNIIHLLTCY